MSDDDPPEPAEDKPAPLERPALRPQLDEDDDEVLEAGPETALMW